jgi:HEAT repeat protein
MKMKRLVSTCVLLVVACTSTVCSSAAYQLASVPGERWAIIISVGGATSASPDAEAIARDMASMLQSAYGYDNLLTLYGADATANNILRLRADLREKIKRGDSLTIVVIGQWTLLPSGGNALIPADGELAQPWTLLPYEDLRDLAASIQAASVVVLLDRCTPGENANYANQAAQMTKGSFVMSRSPARIVSGCVLGSSERGRFIGRVNEELKEFAAAPAGAASGELTLDELLKRVTGTRLPVDVEVDDLGGSPLPFAFTRAGGAIDAGLEATLRNRGNKQEDRLAALYGIAYVIVLEKAGSPRFNAAAALLEGLVRTTDEDEALRVAAIHQLGRLKYERSAELFAALLQDEGDSRDVRIAALESIGLLKAELSHDSIMAAMASKDPELRLAAIRYFPAVSTAADTPALLQRLKQEDQERPLVALVQAAAQAELPAAQLLPALYAVIADSQSVAARREAIRAVGRFGDQSAYSVLSTVLSSAAQPAMVRQDVAYALGKLKYASDAEKAAAATLLAKEVQNADSGVRRGIADSLGRLQVAGSRPLLEQLALRDREHTVRESAVRGLEQFGDAAAVPVLETILKKDAIPGVRRAAASAIGKLGGPQAATALAEAVRDRDGAVRLAAGEALKSLESRGDSVDALLESLYKAKEPRDRVRAIRLLPERDDPKLIAALVSSLESEDAEVRDFAVDKLGLLPGVEVTRQLTLALQNKDDSTRAGAVTALGRIGERAAVSSEPWKQAFAALSKMPRNDPDTKVRVAVARAAGSFADQAAVSVIHSYAHDERSEVVFAAADGFRALAASFARNNNPKMAIEVGERAVGLRTKLMGEMHRETATDCNNLGAYYLLAQDTKGAETYLQRALVIRERTLGANDLDTAVSLANLGSLYQRNGDPKRAEPLLLRVLSIRERALEPGDPAVIQSLENLGTFYRGIGDTGRAEKYQQRATYLMGAKSGL